MRYEKEFNGGDIKIKRLIKESESIVVIQRQLRLSFLFNNLHRISRNKLNHSIFYNSQLGL